MIASPVLAQTGATLTGRITDASGAVVPRSQVTIVEEETGARRTTAAGEAGVYRFDFLPVGPYRIEVSSPGLRTRIVPRLVMEVARTIVQDFRLDVGEISETVHVVSEVPPIDKAMPLGQVIDRRSLQGLPLNGRKILQVALLVPGSVTPPQNAFLAAPSRAQGSQGLNTAGHREETSNFQINGVTLNDQINNILIFQPPLDALQEFRVDNIAPSVENGRNSGASINIVTRSGTNRWAAGLSGAFRHDALDASNAFSAGTEAPFERQEFSAHGGGPLALNRTFFFAAYEGLRQQQGLPVNTVVLSDAERAAVVHPVMRRVVDLLPRATSTDARGISRFVGWADAPVAVDLGSVDLTSSLTSSQRLHAFYAFQRDRRQEPLETGSTVPGFGDVRVGRRQLLTLEHTRTVGSGRVHQTRLGVSGIAFEAEAASALNPADFGLDVGHTRASGLPAFTVPGAFNLGGPVNFPQGRTDQTIVVSHVAGVGFGRHSLKIGGEYRHFTYETRTLDSGAFTFPSVSAFVDGVANSFNVRLGDRAARILQPAVGAFLQDTFRLDPRLTLDLGLRYEWNVTPTEKENRLVVFDPATVSLLRIGVHKEAVYRQNRNAEPRVGVAWDPIGDGRTLLRSAYSVTVEQPLVNTVAQLASNPPLGTVLAITGAIAVESAFGLATAGGLSPITVDPAYRNSSVHAWNVNVQHEIDAGVTLMVAYVATKGSDLRLSRNINQPVDGLRPYRALSELSPILPGTLLGNITQVESSGRSQYRAVWTSLSKRLTRGLAFSASYTWSRSQDTNSQSTPPTAITVQNGYDLDDSWGPSDFDARHRYAVRANYELPLRSHAVVRGWQVAAVLQGQSGNPLNIVTNNATLTGVPNTVRPNVTGPIEIVGDLNRWFNPSVFVAVNEFGNLSRNAVVGPRFDTLDVSLAKTTRIGTRVRAMLQVDAFNVLNVRNYGQPGRVVGSPTFGVITNTRFPPGDSGSSRQVQLSARVYF